MLTDVSSPTQCTVTVASLVLKDHFAEETCLMFVLMVTCACTHILNLVTRTITSSAPSLLEVLLCSHANFVHDERGSIPMHNYFYCS